ncbi:MAG: hypothetical protein LBV45_05320 [Xanthomonadaceae bacterium]|jgi:hypothetical protein|nr:hypothetical protein [Xanthomonadaceae bacterium]
MPIVFIHGVNNRDDSNYRENAVSRDAFLREIVAPALGLPNTSVQILNPYWGGNGVKFAWNMAVLPDADDKLETFGSDTGPTTSEDMLGIVADSVLDAGCGLVENAKTRFPETVETLYAAAMAAATTEEEARALAKSFLRAADYAEQNPMPDWLNAVVDSNFADSLDHHLQTETGDGMEAFGTNGVADRLREAGSRLAGILPKSGSALLGRIGRKRLNAAITRFAGDAFTYLAWRGTRDNPGNIIRIVLASLREALAGKSDGDDKLIVIAHSFGGEIVYDILTHFAPELDIDCLVTVGSQVGLFEEMKLYLESRSDIPPDPPQGKVPKPSGLKRWINVFDRNDILSYRIEPIFTDASDFHYDTGYGISGAHGGYFTRPSFYKWLATQLQEEA